MSLTSLPFIGFALGVIILYYVMPKRIRWGVLLAGSVAFYLIYSVKLSVWLLITAGTIYACGLLLDREERRYQERLKASPDLDKDAKKALKKQAAGKKNLWLWLTAGLNIGIWLYFKFADLFLDSLNRAFSTSFSLMHLALPLGISFYTLQAIGYVVDVSHGKCPAQKNFLKLTLWLSFFPQMIQGPICRYSETAEQLFTPHAFDYRTFKFGAQRALFGYFKKMVIADRAAIIAATVFGNTAQYNGSAFLVALLAYTAQIYGDFSGGIDIISGVAEMLGIHMPANFERPYFSRSVPEYWRRWHITLGAWFRDYVFYPLSISRLSTALGKRCRKAFKSRQARMIPTYLITLVIWTLNGVWHGTGLQFVMFGLYQGALMVLGMITKPITDKWLEKAHVNTECFSWKLGQGIRTFLLMAFGRVFFRASSLGEAFRIIGSMFRDFNPYILMDGTIFNFGLDESGILVLCTAILVLLVVSILQETGMKMRETLEKQNLVFRWLIYLIAIFVIILVGVYGPGYNAADFVYAAF